MYDPQSEAVRQAFSAQVDAENAWTQEQDYRFTQGALYMLSDMRGDHYGRMLHDVRGHDYARRYLDYRVQYIHLPAGKKMVGFAGFDDFGPAGKQKMSHDLTRLVEDRAYCDWLDYNGFIRPKWMPGGRSRTLVDCIELVPYAYRYAMLYRPLGIGCQPTGHTGYEDSDKAQTGFWGVVAYDRPLSDAEIKQFQLSPLQDQ